MVVVWTPIAIQFADSKAQATFEQYIKKLSNLLHVTAIDPKDYLKNPPKDKSFWVVVHKGSTLPRKRLIKSAIKKAM